MLPVELPRMNGDDDIADAGNGGGGAPIKMEQTRGYESLTDRVERRRQQNRLNQRAFREFFSPLFSVYSGMV